MEKITVFKEVKNKEEFSLSIEDLRNCYLIGNDNLNNIKNYLGIWTDNQGLKIIEIRNQRMIGIDISSNKSSSTYVDIQRFMKNNNNVQIISKTFRYELDRLIDLMKEN